MNLLTCSEKIEKIFEKYFQKNVSLCIKDEVLKRGKFLLIRNQVIGNNYYYEMIIERSRKLDVVKIPYPFNIEEHDKDDLIFLDYRLSSLFVPKDHIDDLDKFIENYNIKNTNKFFDNILEMRFE